jgi:3-hydroxyacyl-CoA dehydrogenase
MENEKEKKVTMEDIKATLEEVFKLGDELERQLKGDEIVNKKITKMNEENKLREELEHCIERLENLTFENEDIDFAKESIIENLKTQQKYLFR